MTGGGPGARGGNREERVASVCVPALGEDGDLARTRELAAALFEATPRVAVAGPGLCRADARGWERRGGGEALARRLHRAVRRREVDPAGVGIAGSGVAADAAARLAILRQQWGGSAAGEDAPAPGDGRDPDAAAVEDGELSRDREDGGDFRVVVPAGEEAAFLASLPVGLLPISEETKETLRALGLGRVGEVAARDREELEARFGPEGGRLHRWARGEDERVFPPLSPEPVPSASMELDGAVREVEPLLFVLRRLLARLCGDLEEEGRCAERLVLRLETDGGETEEAEVAPARPTRREDLLLDLCRAALERAEGAPDGTGLPGPVAAVAVEAPERAPAEVRQGDLFAPGRRDPAAVASTLARLRARAPDEEWVVRPDPRPDHRPERRSRWRPVEADERPGGSAGGEGVGGGAGEDGGRLPAEDGGIPGVLRLLPEPRRVDVRADGGRPTLLRDDGGVHDLAAAEGPERLSGDWWRDPYRREYYRVCTEAGELLWLYREAGEDGEPRWWLHGWWD